MTWVESMEILKDMLRREEAEIWFLDDKQEFESTERELHIKRATALRIGIRSIMDRMEDE